MGAAVEDEMNAKLKFDMRNDKTYFRDVLIGHVFLLINGDPETLLST